MNIFWIPALLFAALESFALWKKQPRLEYLAKPGVMIVLFTGLYLAAGFNGAPFWFAAGILLSLAGDILLMLSLDRLFLFGLVAFLLAHISYIIGFNIPMPNLSLWGFAFALMIAIGGARLIRRILSALAEKGQTRMRLPIIIYSVVISIMLLSAMLKISDLSWNAGAAALVFTGAFFFYVSDMILAWNKFVSPIQHGRIYNIGAYHLGQIMLIAGIALQFGK